MKRIALIMVLVALFAINASALQVSSATLGSSNQERNANLSVSVTITNDATATLSGINVVTSSDAQYKLLASNVPTSISAGNSSTFTLSGFIPLNFDGVDSTTLNALALKIGTVTVTGTVNSVQASANADVSMQAINQLEIKKARIECDTSSKNLNDGDTFNNLKPGETCTLEVEVENNFDDNDRNDLKVGDISFDAVEVRIASSNNDVEVSVDDDISSLSADDVDSSTADIEIDEETDDGKVSLQIRISGRDENGALHGEEINVKLDVTRLTHDIQLRRVELTPNRVSNCEDSRVKAVAFILNQGKRNERSAAIAVSVPDLKFSDKREDIELDKDDSQTISFDIPVPKNTKPGVVRVDFTTTYFDNLAELNTGSVDLTIEACAVEEPVVNNTPTTVVVTNPQPTQVTPTTVTVPTPTQGTAAPRKTSFTSSPVYTALLVMGIFVVVAIIVVLVVVLVRSGRKKD